ncbi:MAG: Gfo/Idh/MocA family oxidoreductase [Chloroflexota bacterium]
MNDPIRVCLVGAGRAGMVHAQNFRWRVPHARLVAVVDANLERARQAAAELELGPAGFATLEQALDAGHFEAVVIVTPPFSHAELSVAAAQAGKHVLCEKPMALTLAECDRVLAAVSAAGVIFQMAFMRRFDPPFVAAKQQIDEGLIGRPLVVRSLTRGPGPLPAWVHDMRQSNGVLGELASHDFDAIRWLTGGNYRRVFAQAGAFKTPQVRTEYPDFYDTAIVSLELDNDSFGTVEAVCPADFGYDARAEVIGSKGVLMIGELRETAVTRVTRQEGLRAPHFLFWPARFEKAYLNEDAHFIECIRHQQQPAVTGLDGRLAVEVVLAANHSISTGQPVTLPFKTKG